MVSDKSSIVLKSFNYQSSFNYQRSHLFLQNSPSPTVNTKVHHFNPQYIAEELSIMDSELLRRIKPHELEDGAWMKENVNQGRGEGV